MVVDIALKRLALPESMATFGQSPLTLTRPGGPGFLDSNKTVLLPHVRSSYEVIYITRGREEIFVSPVINLYFENGAPQKTQRRLPWI